MITRILLFLGLAGLALVPFAPARQAAPKKSAAPLSELKIVEKVNAATDRALDYLEKKQIKEGDGAGAWRTDNNAINALAILAYLSRGHVPGRGKYGDTRTGDTVRSGVLSLAKKFMLAKQSKDKAKEGYLALGGGRMYEHGLATLALAELYGMDPDPALEEGLRKAVNLILRSQGKGLGGWNYEPTAQDGDLSVSVMQIVALRAATNAMIPVPKSAIANAVKYVRHKQGVGYGYGYAGPGAGTPQTSAAGVLSMQLLGQYKDKHIEKTLEYLSTSVKVSWDGGGASYFYYFHYYAIQGFYQHGGKLWNDWHPKVRELLLEKQNKDGSWDAPAGTAEASIDSTTKTYTTAMATLVLNIYQHYLPAYQR